MPDELRTELERLKRLHVETTFRPYDPDSHANYAVLSAVPALIEFAQRTEPLIIAAMNGALDGPEDVEVEMAVEAWKRLLEALR